jgi:hypothetical protein
MVVTPTYPLLELKALPAFNALFKRQLAWGEYFTSSRRFIFSDIGKRRAFGDDTDQRIPTTVYFGYAANPDSLESATIKGGWLDEAGQDKFKLASWEALQRRAAIHQARFLITTTPYNLGWLKQQVYDRWKSGDRDYDVIRFDSTENPAFPRAEFERARATLPRWKFDLFYRALFTRPAGMIYDCFDEKRHKCPRFEIPPNWPRFLGLDFGGVNTAGVFYARDPGSVPAKYYAYREYHAGGRTAAEHVAALLKGEPGIPVCAGGAKSEQQWRDEFAAAGLPVYVPDIADIEVGIDRVYGAHKTGQLVVFDDLAGYLEEKLTYSRKLNDRGEPTEEIEEKNTFHRLDAERYIVPSLVVAAEVEDGHAGDVTVLQT